MNRQENRPKVLIMTPGILPVPAVRGGAVEKLITDLIDENENRQVLNITLVTIADENILPDKYHNTRIVQAEQTKLCKYADRIIDKLQRMLHFRRSMRMFDHNMIRTLKNEVKDPAEYDVIIVENMIGLAESTLKLIENNKSCAKSYFHIHNNIDMYRSPAGICKLVDKKVAFISVSKYLENEILKVSPKANVSVLLNGLDNKLMDISLRNDKESLRIKYDIPGNAIVVLYSGRFIAEKGVYELVQSFVWYKQNNPDSNLFLALAGGGIGADGQQTEYEKKVLDEIYRIQNSCKLLGKIQYEKMPEIYALADVLAVPTLDNEPFGMVVLEGMAMGLPIITTASGGIREVLEDEAGSMIVSTERISEELVTVFEKIDSEDFGIKLEAMGAHNQRVFMNKRDARKEDYFDRFLSVIGLNSEGK